MTETETLRLVSQEIADEIVAIMETYDQQQAERGYVDTPGGLEHMGDVWRLLDEWRDRLKSAPRLRGLVFIEDDGTVRLLWASVLGYERTEG